MMERYIMEWSITFLMKNQNLEQNIPCHRLHSTRDC
uniref:Uncharacterized protein n=1 Tax=Arundo donax TaxID=35708 RepID=A0A0A9E788_ARUDO